MENVFCDKPGHMAYPLRAYEKDGRIYVDMNSCQECGPREIEEKTPTQSILNSLRDISGRLDSLKWDVDELKDEVDELLEEHDK